MWQSHVPRRIEAPLPFTFFWSGKRSITGCGVFCLNSVLFASSRPHPLRANSIVATCIPEAKAEERDFLFARITRPENLSFHSALAEPARHKHAGNVPEPGLRIGLIEGLGIDFQNFHIAIGGRRGVGHRLDDRFIGIFVIGVFADERDRARVSSD